MRIENYELRIENHIENWELRIENYELRIILRIGN